MSIKHTWSIANLERTTSDDGVTVAHWRCSSTDGPRIASAHGTTSYTPNPSSDDFTPYADLTEAVVLGWVHEQVVQADVEASNEAKIEAIANPTSVSGKPW
tara:strand:- start:435 stop:737 length:303 start_codon:yes stop_codon:yes gene_type:complete